jgi:hypothetical protein
MRAGLVPPLPLTDPLERTAIADVVTRALSPDPSERFQTVETFANALRAVRDHIASNAAAGDIFDAETLAKISNDWDAAGSIVEPSIAEPSAPGLASNAAAQTSDKAPNAWDDNVQFTVFRPKSLAPARWYAMLVFAHLSEARADADPNEPDPVQEVQRQAAAILGDTSSHRQQTVESLEAVPREGELTIVPHAEGVEFNPVSRTFRWSESVQREEFRLRAGAALAPGVIRGRVSIYLGALVIAEIALPLKIEPAGSRQRDDVVRDTVRPYRRIFASYSHRDRAIVDEYAEYARAIGDRYLQDVIDLRSGERWLPALEGMIERADVFQLFWSWNALDSEYVRREWQYALELRRPAFIRPVYWDEPMPAAAGLPPSALRELNFERIRPRHVPAVGVPVTQPSAPVPADARLPLPPSAPPPAESPYAATRTTPRPDAVSSPPSPGAPPAASTPRAMPSSPPIVDHDEPTMTGRHRPEVARHPLPTRARIGSRARMLAAAAAILLAIVVAPMIYVGMRPGTVVGVPPTAAPPAERDVALSIRTADGSRASAVTVQLFRANSPAPEATITTDRFGAATLKGVSPGSYRIVISTRGRRLAETHVDVQRGGREQPVQIDIPAEAPAN